MILAAGSDMLLRFGSAAATSPSASCADRKLDLGFGFEANLAVLHFDGVLDGVAPVFLAELLRLLLDEGAEGIEARCPGQLFAGALFCLDECFEQCLHLVRLLHHVRTLDGEWLGCVICRFGLRLFLYCSQSLDRKQRILRAAISFFLDLELLPP